MKNTCIGCGRTLTTFVDDEQTTIKALGETDCCCGDHDADGDYVNATCSACCAPHHSGPQIWEGKSTGGGYYIRC